jgi:hypothetical protein
MKLLKTLALIVALFSANLAFSQTQKTAVKKTPPSDQPSGYTYDFDKTQHLILDRLNNPGAFNADVQPLLNDKDFPVLTKGQSPDAAFLSNLRTWMEKHPDLIINTLKNRNDIVHPY